MLDISNLYYVLLIFQTELDMLTEMWNDHYIRKTTNEQAFYGRPSLMFESPQLYNTRSYLCEIDRDVIDACKESDLCTLKKECPCQDESVFDLCVELMEEKNLDPPQSASDSLELYLSLRAPLRHLLHLD